MKTKLTRLLLVLLAGIMIFAALACTDNTGTGEDPGGSGGGDVVGPGNAGTGENPGGSGGGSDRDPGRNDLTSIIEQIVPLGPGDGGEETEIVEIPSEEVPLVSLPQTGQLWWPVPLLLAGGVMMILIGIIYQKKGNTGHGKRTK